MGVLIFLFTNYRNMTKGNTSYFIHGMNFVSYKFIAWRNNEVIPLFKNVIFMLVSVQADAGVTDAILGRWKCGFAQANKVDIILSALSTGSYQGGSENCLKGVLALSPWGLSAALWNLIILLRHHCECRLKQNCKTFSAEDNQVCMVHIIQ